MAVISMLISLGIACSGEAGGVSLRITKGSNDLGKWVFSFELLPNGDIVQKHYQEVKLGSRTAILDGTLRYDPKGRPLRAELKAITDGRKGAMVVTYSVKGASVSVTEVGKKPTSKEYPALRGVPIGDATLFWFLRDQPRPGTVATFQEFVPTALQWRTTKRTYIGKVTISVGKKKVTAHKCKDAEKTLYLDNKGLAYRIEMPNGVVMIREEKK